VYYPPAFAIDPFQPQPQATKRKIQFLQYLNTCEHADFEEFVAQFARDEDISVVISLNVS